MTSLSASCPGQLCIFLVAMASRSACGQWHKWKTSKKKKNMQSKKQTGTKLSINTRKKKKGFLCQTPPVGAEQDCGQSPQPWLPQLPRVSFHDTHDSSDPPGGAPGHTLSLSLSISCVSSRSGEICSARRGGKPFPELCHRGTGTDVLHPLKDGGLPHDQAAAVAGEQRRNKRVKETPALTHAAHQRHQVSSELRLTPKRGSHPRSWLRRAVVQVRSCHESERPKKEQHTLGFACLLDWLTSLEGSSDSLSHPERAWSGFLRLFSWFGGGFFFFLPLPAALTNQCFSQKALFLFLFQTI